MHEYSLVADLMRQVEDVARSHGVTRGVGRVQRLHLAVGELSGVEIPLLETAYATFRERTLCADAELKVRRVAATWACPGCGRPPRAGAVLRCDACGLPARLTAGDEIVLESIALETPEMESPELETPITEACHVS